MEKEKVQLLANHLNFSFYLLEIKKRRVHDTNLVNWKNSNVSLK